MILFRLSSKKIQAAPSMNIFPQIMTKLLFPKSNKQRADGFRNLNGDGAKFQLLISLPIIFALGIALWFIPDTRNETGISWPGTIVIMLGFFYLPRLLNATIVDHSPEAMRITRRGKKYIIPYEDVLSVSESGKAGRKTIGTHSRYVTVRLKKPYPFGNSFSFYTKKDYTEFDGLSGESKLIQNYAAMTDHSQSQELSTRNM